MLPAQFHVVSRLLTVLKIEIFKRRFDSYTFTNKAWVAFWREFHFNQERETTVKSTT